jgi:[ribosomal protein S5]-alanine N-acetyltransferase
VTCSIDPHVSLYELFVLVVSFSIKIICIDELGTTMKIDFDDFVIRDWQMEDAPAIARYADNYKIWMNLRDLFPHPYSRQDAEQFITAVMSAAPPRVYAIADSNEAIGSIGLMVKDDVHRFTAELGYWLAEPFWGSGIMTRAVEGIANYALTVMGMHRVFAEPFATNTASVRVLEKAGFLLEGKMRASAVKDGKVLDQYLYARTIKD